MAARTATGYNRDVDAGSMDDGDLALIRGRVRVLAALLPVRLLRIYPQVELRFAHRSDRPDEANQLADNGDHRFRRELAKGAM